MLLFYPICYAAALLKLTYYTQYYAQEQQLLSDYVTPCVQFCMSNSLHKADDL